MMMNLRFSASIALALICAPSTLSFTVPLLASPTFVGSRAAAPLPTRNQLSLLHMSESESSVPRKRRKRKDGKNIEVTQEVVELEPVVEAKEEVVIVEKAKPVEVKVQDIRDVVSGKAPVIVPEPQPVFEEDDDDELEDDEEYEYYYEEDDKEIIVGTSTTRDNSLEDLLADARKMRESNPEVDEVSIPGAIKNVISTILTIDFFVVCGFLAWFLAGIFCSYIIKDDTVQIAFNSNFEQFVLPALGILMVGSAAGSLFGTPEA